VVQVAVARKVYRGCRWLTIDGRARKRTSCGSPFWLLAEGGGAGWRLARGSHVVRVRAIDAAGRAEAPRIRKLVVR
jgi:hypothetical protein